MGRKWLALVAVAFVATAAPADAATVTRTYPIDPFGSPYGEGTVVFTAAAGEANQLEIRHDTDGVTLTDAANVVSTTACTQVDRRTVHCSGGGLSVVLGDGDDTAQVIGARALPSVLRIEAGTGADVVTGGPTRERIVDGGAGEADRFSGGGGHDEVSYEGRRTPVRVVLGGENEDVLDGIAAVTGGDGDDVLIGDGEANALAGGPGDDRLDGGSGDDDLYGDGGDDRLLGGDGDDMLSGDAVISATGRDVLEGGRGDDRFDLSAADDDQVSIAGPTYDPLPDGKRDVARCGAGIDMTFDREARDVVRSCEAIEVDPGFGLVQRLERVSPSHVRLTIVRTSEATEPFRVFLVPRRGQRTRLTRSVRVVDRTRVSLALTPAGRRHLRRSGAVRVVIPSLDVAMNATVTR